MHGCRFHRFLITACGLWCAAISTAHAFTTVVVDAGHGGGDPGSSWNGLVEKQLCLDTAKRLETALKAKGFTVVLTRKDDEYIELSKRSEIANQQTDAIFVSVHYDASRDKRANGFETHYQSTKGKELAQSISAAMAKSVPGRNRGANTQDLKVLRETKCVAVLVECGFISNKEEASNCGSVAHRQKIADAIADGIATMKDKL